MKPISNRSQIIIAFLPLLNLFCLPLFIYNSFLAKFTLKDYLRSWVYLIFPAVFVVILREVIIFFFFLINDVFKNVCTYLILLIVGLRLAKYQERYM